MYDSTERPVDAAEVVAGLRDQLYQQRHNEQAGGELAFYGTVAAIAFAIFMGAKVLLGGGAPAVEEPVGSYYTAALECDGVSTGERLTVHADDLAAAGAMLARRFPMCSPRDVALASAEEIEIAEAKAVMASASAFAASEDGGASAGACGAGASADATDGAQCAELSEGGMADWPVIGYVVRIGGRIAELILG
ncbi:MAG: hypothetical protein R3D33_15885 [Hyphomicrobiaceae bacterium]